MEHFDESKVQETGNGSRSALCLGGFTEPLEHSYQLQPIKVKKHCEYSSHFLSKSHTLI